MLSLKDSNSPGKILPNSQEKATRIHYQGEVIDIIDYSSEGSFWRQAGVSERFGKTVHKLIRRIVRNSWSMFPFFPLFSHY